MTDVEKIKKAEEYICSACQKTFLTVEDEKWNSELAELEYSSKFKAESVLGMSREIVCDDCYKVIMEKEDD